MSLAWVEELVFVKLCISCVKDITHELVKLGNFVQINYRATRFSLTYEKSIGCPIKEPLVEEKNHYSTCLEDMYGDMKA